MRISVGLIIFLLTACAGSPIRVGHMSDAELDQTAPGILCNAYHNGHYKNVRAAIIRRGFVPQGDWALIDAGQIRRGMSEAELICAWGAPSPLDGKVNTYVGPNGTEKQWVYRTCISSLGCNASYVYTQNGLITSWQQ